MITITKNRVVLDRASYEAFQNALTYARAQIGQRRQAEAVLRERLHRTSNLLLLATRELAEASGAPDVDHFIRQWLDEHRRPDFGGIPFVVSRSIKVVDEM